MRKMKLPLTMILRTKAVETEVKKLKENRIKKRNNIKQNCKIKIQKKILLLLTTGQIQIWVRKATQWVFLEDKNPKNKSKCWMDYKLKYLLSTMWKNQKSMRLNSKTRLFSMTTLQMRRKQGSREQKRRGGGDPRRRYFLSRKR